MYSKRLPQQNGLTFDIVLRGVELGQEVFRVLQSLRRTPAVVHEHAACIKAQKHVELNTMAGHQVLRKWADYNMNNWREKNVIQQKRSHPKVHNKCTIISEVTGKTYWQRLRGICWCAKQTDCSEARLLCCQRCCRT